MFNLKEKISIGKYSIQIYKKDVCPFCEKGIDPIIVTAFYIDGTSGCVLYVAMRCPICGDVFLCKYYLGLSISDAAFTSMCFPFSEVLGGGYTKQSFSEEIEEISPDFVRIYNQAYEAEQKGLNEIDGMGYRKAFEFLIKDYAIAIKPDEKETIIKMTLSNCVDYMFSDKEKAIIKITSWVGNDQTHYEKKHEQYNVSDLKKMILICVAKIETAIREKKYIEDFEKKEND